MPDLSRRPERYATVVVTALILGAASYFGLGVRLTTGSHKARADPAGNAHTVIAPTCASFPDREAAQVFWNAHRAEFPRWDGNHNGVACEQLKSVTQVAVSKAPSPAGATPTPTAPASEPAGRRLAGGGSAVLKKAPRSTATAPTAGLPAKEPAAPPQKNASPPASKPTAPAKAQILATRKLFGLDAPTQDEFTGVETSLARDTQIQGYFQGWDTAFRLANINAAWSAGHVPMLTWESRSLAGGPSTNVYSLNAIATGELDGYITTYARAIAANGLPLIIRFDQEMNGNWYRWAEQDTHYGNAPGSYIAAWRHIWTLFQAAGANRLVVWDWSPNRVDNIGNLPGIENYYPGDQYVDLVGMTGYSRTGDKNPTFAGDYDSTLSALRTVAPGKPILLSEVGATENGGHKPAFITSFFAGLLNNPDVIGFVWFDYAVTSTGVTDDWRVNSTTAALDAFRAGVYASDYGLPAGRHPRWGAGTSPAPSATPSPTPTMSSGSAQPVAASTSPSS